MSAGWAVIKEDASEVQTDPWSCVPGTPPTSHSNLQ